MAFFCWFYATAVNHGTQKGVDGVCQKKVMQSGTELHVASSNLNHIQLAQRSAVSADEPIRTPPSIAYLFASPLVQVHRRHASWSTGCSKQMVECNHSVANRGLDESHSTRAKHTQSFHSKSQCQHLPVTTVTPIIEQLDPDKEFQYLCYGIGKSHLKLDASIFSKIPQVHRMAATLENLCGVLEDRSRRHQIIHVSCHCIQNKHDSNDDPDRVLLFEDDDGGAHTINTTTLKQMFCEHALHNSVKLLVLMACDTDRIAQALSTSTVESVIGTKGKVSDAVAAYFTEHLYLALASELTH